MAIHLRNRGNKNKHMVIGALCQSWKCTRCGPYLRSKWLQYLTYRLAQENKVYTARINKDIWDTVSKRIARANGNFATIELPGNILVIFTDTNIKGGTIASLSTALEMLEESFYGSILDRRPVHTSRGWKLPNNVNKMSEWERIDKLPITVPAAEKVVRALGLSVKCFWEESRSGFLVDIPDEWGKGGDSKLCIALAGGGIYNEEC